MDRQIDREDTSSLFLSAPPAGRHPSKFGLQLAAPHPPKMERWATTEGAPMGLEEHTACELAGRRVCGGVPLGKIYRRTNSRLPICKFQPHSASVHAHTHTHTPKNSRVFFCSQHVCGEGLGNMFFPPCPISKSGGCLASNQLNYSCKSSKARAKDHYP